MSDTSGSNTSADAVGMTMGAVSARAAAERVLDTADRKPPFPGELTVGFPGELKEKRGGDKEARFPDGLG